MPEVGISRIFRFNISLDIKIKKYCIRKGWKMENEKTNNLYLLALKIAAHLLAMIVIQILHKRSSGSQLLILQDTPDTNSRLCGDTQHERLVQRSIR